MSAQPQRLVAALDLGSTKVVGADRGGDRRRARTRAPRSSAWASSAAAGIRRGVVRDIEETTRAIDKAMKSAQRMAGVEVGSAYCGIAGEHVAGRSSHGMVSVTGDEIRTSDVARVNDMASNVSFGRDHELLHAIPQDYLIDQQGGINEPIGMTGSRLEAEVYLVTVLSSVLQNLKKCVERAGLPRRGVRAGAAGGVAGGADAGRDRARLRHRGAGRRVDQRVDLPQREDPAHRLAALRRRPRDRRHRPRAAGHPARRRAAQGALRRRRSSRWCPRATSSIFRARRDRAPGTRSAGCSRTSCTCGSRKSWSTRSTRSRAPGIISGLPAGVILTGGGALTPGIVELAREVFAMPARCGIPGQRLRGLADSVESPRMAVPAGLVLYGARQVAMSGGFGTGARKSPAVEKVLAPVKRWLQDFF